MKVLDIISEGQLGAYVWKYFGKESAKHAVARETVEDIATTLFNNYGRRGIEPPPGIVGETLERHPAGAGFDDATKQQVKVEISRYYRDLEKKFASSRLPAKPVKTGATDVAAGAARAGWAQLKTIGLCRTIFVAWAVKDIWNMVDFYHTNMQLAFESLEKGQRGEQGGISLEAFHKYHKEQLTQLVAQLIVTKPARMSVVPILGWIGKLLNTGPGSLAWISFINAKVFDGPDGKMSVRNYVDNFCVWSLKSIPFIGPFLPDQVISDLVGEPLKWAEDSVKEAWVNWLQNGPYKGKEIPESLMPPNFSPDPSNPEDKKKYAPPGVPNAAKVMPADVDSQAGTNPSKNNGTTSSNLDKNWKDLGNGFEAHVHTGAIRVSPGANKR